MSYTFDIRPSPTLRKGGWNLHLYENGKAAGLIDFPAHESAQGQSEATKVAFQRAEAEAKLWVQGRQVYSRRRRLVVHPALAILLAGVVVITLYNVIQFIL